MITIIFDKGTNRERSLQVDKISERPIVLTLNGYRVLRVNHESDFPDLSSFALAEEFSTVEVLDGNQTPLPICSRYNKINDLTINYDDAQKIATVCISIGLAGMGE